MTAAIPGGAATEGGEGGEAPDRQRGGAPTEEGAGVPKGQGSETVLEVRGLRTLLRSAGTEQLPVDGVSFELAAGETVAVVGESGSGKSMTALSLMGLLPKVAKVVGGSARLGGHDLLGLTTKQVRQLRGVEISYMPQDPVSALNPALTIGRQVAEPLLVHRTASRAEAARRALELLGRLGIPDLPDALDAYPHQLSGGMRQRVLLAMSLIGRPKVLIADEPTTSVDVTTQEQIIDLLGDIQRETRLAVILITHDLGVVARLARRVLVMYAGRVVENGSADQVFEQPTHPYTRGLLQSVDFDGVAPLTRLYALDGNPPQLAELPSGCPFNPRCAYRVEICVDAVPELGPVPGSEALSACHLARQGVLPPPAVSLLPAGTTAAPVDPEAGEPPGQGPAVADTPERSPSSAALGTAPLLVAEAVTKTFRARRGALGRHVEVRAVSEVDLRLERGETFGLVGETGSGKSTLGRLVLGLERVTSGEVRLDGSSIAGFSRGQLTQMRRRVQVVFQDPYESLNPYMTVEEILEEPFRIHGLYRRDETLRRIRELLELVGLPAGALGRTPGQFSGGQQQRIAIARALSLGAELLVADEPTAALDVSIQAQILNLLMELQRERAMTVLLISHNLLVVRHMSASLGVMYGGRIVETGRSEDVYRQPKHPYSVALLSAIPVANPRRERERARVRISGEAPDPARLPDGCPFHTRCWLAVERCRTERPLLRPVGAPGQQAACHLAT
ncbi:MAG TPA: ABC transporter ATP-binding protein [Acidimicrobiales bacterium]|nr:ABC transporter ATP-binding protein [Acidimicrobiales bacterium]